MREVQASPVKESQYERWSRRIRNYRNGFHAVERAKRKVDNRNTSLTNPWRYLLSGYERGILLHTHICYMISFMQLLIVYPVRALDKHWVLFLNSCIMREKSLRFHYTLTLVPAYSPRLVGCQYRA